MKLGIGINTRNRPVELRQTLEAIADLTKTEHKIVVVDDCSYPHVRADIEDLHKHIPCRMMLPENHLGISKAKNLTIRTLMEDDPEYVVLFEDDVRPVAKDWEQRFIETSIQQHMAHLLYLPKYYGDDIFGKTVSSTGTGTFRVDWKLHGSGLLMFFTGSLLKDIGGFDERFKSYGWEHNEFTARALAAQRLCPVFYPHCVAAELDPSIESDDFKRRPMWTREEKEHRKREAKKNEPLYLELLQKHKRDSLLLKEKDYA